MRYRRGPSLAFALIAAGLALASLAPSSAAREPAAGGGKRNYFSAPDNLYGAAIITTKTRESEVAIGPSHGKVRFRKSFASADGEHGARVTKGAWTADSRFFVFMIESSGGHQPWHRPMFFWDRRDNRLYSLDQHIGAVTGGFELAPPDIVRCTARADLKDLKNLDGDPFVVSLSSVAANYRPE